MARSPSVIVVGSYVHDFVWRCAAAPRPGETAVGLFARGHGGKGSNQAVAACRAGADTMFVGAVGADSLAAAARAFHRAEGLRPALAAKKAAATGTAGIVIDAAGQNRIVVALGANELLAAADLPSSRLLAGARVLVTQLEANLAATALALRRAWSTGLTTVLNPAPMRSEFDPALLAHVDVLIPNETEFVALVNRLAPAGRAPLAEADLAQLKPPALHALCRTLGVPTVIVTLGARGCLVSEPARHAHLPAHRGIRVVDTTGAGDAFVGAFAAALAKKPGDVPAAARFGNAAAALSVTQAGAAAAMPRAREITRLLRGRR